MQEKGSNPVNTPRSSAAAKAMLLVGDEARALALEAGFTEAGVVALPHAQEARDAGRFGAWLDAGRAGTMQYLARTSDEGEPVRARAAIPFPWARSAIVCAMNYHGEEPRSTDSAPDGAGWIARYAWSSRMETNGERRPSDYHKVLLKRLRGLEARLHERHGEFESRAYVDTGPVVERSLAVAAGLGWQGKNTCLIHPKQGSYTFLAVLLTSLEVASDLRTLEPVPDHCGTCRRCLDACPTNALIAPYAMDARLCISYLTIEHRGPIEPRLMEQMGRQVFGCDICQDVCPWNRKAPIGTAPDLAVREGLVNPALDWLGSLDEQAFEKNFNGSPVRRAGFSGLRRNVAIAMGNSGERRFTAQLTSWLTTADEGLRAAARWAMGRLEDRSEARSENRSKKWPVKWPD